MRETTRQHGTLLMLQDSVGKGRALVQVPFGSPPFREERLQRLLGDHPEMIPISEIEPAFGPAVFLGREVPVSGGSLDLLYASPNGYLTLVETKLWDSPGARREVVAQIIDYATDISGWDFEDLNNAVRGSQAADGRPGTKDVLTAMREVVGDLDEREFIDSISRNLARGRFLLLIIGNGIREGVERMSAFLQANPGLDCISHWLWWRFACTNCTRTANTP